MISAKADLKPAGQHCLSLCSEWNVWNCEPVTEKHGSLYICSRGNSHQNQRPIPSVCQCLDRNYHTVVGMKAQIESKFGFLGNNPTGKIHTRVAGFEHRHTFKL